MLAMDDRLDRNTEENLVEFAVRQTKRPDASQWEILPHPTGATAQQIAVAAKLLVENGQLPESVANPVLGRLEEPFLKHVDASQLDPCRFRHMVEAAMSFYR